MMRIFVKKFNMRYIKDNYELRMNLRKARETADLTQNEVSKIINLDRTSLACYENGKIKPSIFTLIKLAEIYNVNLLNLLVI